MERINLVGSEEVSRAGTSISHAADQMSRVAAQFDETAQRLITAMSEFAERMETLQENRNV